MKNLFILLMMLPAMLSAQNKYYVATNGNDNNPGTITKPFATWQRGFTATNMPGDTLFIRGGVYMSELPVNYDPDWASNDGGARGGMGTYEHPIVITGYPGEWPILDCRNHCENIPFRDTGKRYNGGVSFSNTEHITAKNFEVCNVYQCDSVVAAGVGGDGSCNLTFENIIIHDVGQRGFGVQGGVYTSSDGPDVNVPIDPPKWGFNHYDTTRFINCDVYNLCDTFSTEPGNAADAWKTIHYNRNHVEFIGCRAWNYTDDGFDPTGTGASRYFENCWAMPGDKYKGSISEDWEVERNGFKISGPGRNFREGEHFTKLTNCIAYGAAHGLTLMEDKGYARLNAVVSNCLFLRCQLGIANWDDDRLYVASPNIFKNNVVYGTTTNNAAGFPSHTFILTEQPYDVSNCSWKWGPYPPYFQNSIPNPDYNITDADWGSLDHETVFAQLTAPRNPDGSLPYVSALQLTAGSDLIDGGVDIGNPYYGSAPDLGPFEYRNPLDPNKVEDHAKVKSSSLIYVSDSKIRIELDDTYKFEKISLYNFQGKTVVNQLVKNSICTLNTSGLPGGLYFILISNSSYCETYKVIVR